MICRTGPKNNNQRVGEEVGMHLMEGVAAFAEGKYEEAARRMLPVRHLVHTIGGSHAQVGHLSHRFFLISSLS